MSTPNFPRRRPGTAFRSFGDEGLVVVPDQAEVNVLNEVGTLVLSLLDGTRSAEQIAAAVAEQFDVDPEQARKDVEAFLEELHRKGMLSRSEPSQESAV